MTRNQEILAKYRNGKTLGRLGEEFGVTRSRIQQIVIKEIEKEILEMNQVGATSKEERDLLKFAAKQEVEKIVETRKTIDSDKLRKENYKRIQDKILALGDPLMFVTISNFAKALNETPEDLKLYAPEVVSRILEAAKKRWSRYYLKCKTCSTTAIKHRNYGYCIRCWPKSEMNKRAQQNSFLRHFETRQASVRRYQKEYGKRPAIIEKRKREHDLKFFGGNREKALERDEFKCQVCGMSAQENKKLYGKGLFVKHMGHSTDHALEKLRTVCSACHSRAASRKGLAKMYLLGQEKKKKSRQLKMY